jgi:redox-sensitive bicupin YhaK (pirin superfamily)
MPPASVSGHLVEHVIAPNCRAWVQLARGAATLNNHALKEGDGASLDDEDTVQVAAESDCEVLLFDLN